MGMGSMSRSCGRKEGKVVMLSEAREVQGVRVSNVVLFRSGEIR